MSRRLYFLAVLLSACGTTPGARPVSQIPVCTPLDSTAAWARANRAWSQEAGQSWSNDSLRRVLLELRDQDQSARADFGSRIGDSVYARHLTTIDSVLATRMAEILDRFGLPRRSMVGAAGSDAAMLIVQHCWSLQERVLALAEALPPGQLSPQALAMLDDRVRVHQGKPQRFGTQFNAGADGIFRFAPASDLPGLAVRRAQAGLPPLTQYVCLMEEAGIRIDRSSLPRELSP